MEKIKEIGGYIELDSYHYEMLHGDGIKLNCGRNALDYIIKAKKIKKILMPKFMCDSCNKVLKRNNVQVKYFNIDIDFRPIIDKVEEDEWVYVVNYYGQLSDEIICSLEDRLILDNTQSYFSEPLEGVNTIYSCRKFFGVSDGAILYTDTLLDENFDVDESYSRMNYLLGRFERTASEFYAEYMDNNKIFIDEPIKKMSRLTENLLRAIDYERVEKIRTNNFMYLNNRLESINMLNLKVPQGAFMYPFYIENGNEIRKKLQEKKIYIPVLWPTVFEICKKNTMEYSFAKNILPLPVDQRYSYAEMDYICEQLLAFI